MHKRAQGRAIEQAACEFLTQRGLQCLATNYQIRGGELDLVMRDQNGIVFVEVRYRKSDRYGTPAETVTAAKQQKLWRTAQHFLLQNGSLRNLPCRFDIVAVRPAEDGSLQFEWLQHVIGS